MNAQIWIRSYDVVVNKTNVGFSTLVVHAYHLCFWLRLRCLFPFNGITRNVLPLMFSDFFRMKDLLLDIIFFGLVAGYLLSSSLEELSRHASFFRLIVITYHWYVIITVLSAPTTYHLPPTTHIHCNLLNRFFCCPADIASGEFFLGHLRSISNKFWSF